MLIVKKMPILQGFPDFETVKNLSGNATENVNFSPLFYDIETTGLGLSLIHIYPERSLHQDQRYSKVPDRKPGVHLVLCFSTGC